MNANLADCDCERCEIDRERVLYQRAWLTAFREATTAQVSAALDAAGKRHPARLAGSQWGPCWR